MDTAEKAKTNKEQVSAFIDTAFANYYDWEVDAALKEMHFPGPELSNVEELTRIMKTLMVSFSPELVRNVLYEKGFRGTEEVEGFVGERDITIPFANIIFTEIFGRHDLRPTNNSGWEKNMLEDGFIFIALYSEYATTGGNPTARTLHLRSGAKIIKNDDTLIISTLRHHRHRGYPHWWQWQWGSDSNLEEFRELEEVAEDVEHEIAPNELSEGLKEEIERAGEKASRRRR